MIYLITNRINGKQYVGLTTRSPLERFEEHCKADSGIGKAIRKYGRKNFILNVIDEADSKEELLIAEIENIKKYNTFKNGYNQTIGGDGVTQDLYINVELTEPQEKFVEFVNKENKKEIDVYNSQEMVKTILFNLSKMYLVCEKKTDKRAVAKTLLKVHKPLLEQMTKLRVFNISELQKWSSWKCGDEM